MLAHELTRLEQAYALDSQFAKEKLRKGRVYCRIGGWRFSKPGCLTDSMGARFSVTQAPEVTAYRGVRA